MALMFEALGPMVLQRLPEIVKDGHLKSLAKSLIPGPRVDEYKKLRWFVLKPSKSLVLGDVGCLFEVAGKKRFISSSGKDDDLKNVYLPIGSNTLVIGTALASVPDVVSRSINESFARSSREFFVCRESSSEMEELLTVLGAESEILSMRRFKSWSEKSFLKVRLIDVFEFKMREATNADGNYMPSKHEVPGSNPGGPPKIMRVIAQW